MKKTAHPMKGLSLCSTLVPEAGPWEGGLFLRASGPPPLLTTERNTLASPPSHPKPAITILTERPERDGTEPTESAKASWVVGKAKGRKVI
ncbi:hypothetical protein CRG98_049627 [Punica granatum]|uniref:Uncharacterized protein n=1 Tax=Punica granatum TaxID=22663 RepID=A0A2I0H8D9_PUNGR|nr:hypothetical protein CRG98_049627 [Punica granatum]